MRSIIYILLALQLAACGDVGVDVADSKHVAFVSVAETWREVCNDRYNEFDFPVKRERTEFRAECNRAFADGEEVLDIPELPTNNDDDILNGGILK